MIDRSIAFAAAGFVITGERGNAFEQSRFSRAVLADDDGDGAIEGKIQSVAQERQTGRIGVVVGNTSAFEADALEIRRRQIDVAVLARHTPLDNWLAASIAPYAACISLSLASARCAAGRAAMRAA